MERNRMYLLTMEDWEGLQKKVSKVQYAEYVRESYYVTKFIKLFADDLEYHFSEKFKLEVQTKLKAQVYYHRLRALRGVSHNNSSKLIDENLLGIACLYIAVKTDDTVFSSEMCVQFYLAQREEQRKDLISTRPSALFSKNIDTYAVLSEELKQKRKTKLSSIISALTKKNIQDENAAMLKAEMEALVMLGFDLEVETAYDYVVDFINAYSEPLMREYQLQQQQNAQGNSSEEKGQKLTALLNKMKIWAVDVYRFNLCLYYTPIQLALAVIKIAQHFDKLTLPDFSCQPWWKFFNSEKYGGEQIASEAEIDEPFNLFLSMIKKIK